MDAREKALRGLAACLPETENPAIGCGECPYDCYKAESVVMPLALMEDIRAALKARVISLEEAVEADVCWLEIFDVERIVPIQVSVVGEHTMVRRFGGLTEVGFTDEVGVLFRFWSMKPTGEERKATPWN